MRWLFFLLFCSAIVYAVPPSVVIDYLPTDIYLISGGTVSVRCNATVTDPEGNISSASGTLSSSDHAAPDDNNDHYSGSCGITGTGIEANVSCLFLVEYYADPGEWLCNITVSADGENSSNSTDGTVHELKAIDVSGVDYDDGSGRSIPHGNISAEAVMDITNLGNVDVELEVIGTDMTCTFGSIPVGNQRFSKDNGFGYGVGTSLTTGAQTVSSFSVSRRTDDTSPSIGSLYWLISVPTLGVGGNCSGTMSVDAI